MGRDEYTEEDDVEDRMVVMLIFMFMFILRLRLGTMIGAKLVVDGFREFAAVLVDVGVETKPAG